MVAIAPLASTSQASTMTHTITSQSQVPKSTNQGLDSNNRRDDDTLVSAMLPSADTHTVTPQSEASKSMDIELGGEQCAIGTSPSAALPLIGTSTATSQSEVTKSTDQNPDSDIQCDIGTLPSPTLPPIDTNTAFSQAFDSTDHGLNSEHDQPFSPLSDERIKSMEDNLRKLREGLGNFSIHASGFLSYLFPFYHN